MKEKEHCPHLLRLMRSSPESRENTVCPIIGGDVKSTEHLWGSDGLGVHAHLLVRLPALCHCLHEHVDTLRLSRATRPQCHHAMSDGLRLEQLDQLEDPRRVKDEAKLCHLVGVNNNNFIVQCIEWKYILHFGGCIKTQYLSYVVTNVYSKIKHVNM